MKAPRASIGMRRERPLVGCLNDSAASGFVSTVAAGKWGPGGSGWQRCDES